MQNQVFENIEVIAFFHNLKIDIVRFKWRNEVYRVTKINSLWKIPTGNSYEIHYSILCDEKKVVCEIAFNLDDFKWQLIQYEVYD